MADQLDSKKSGDVARTTLKLREFLPCGICAMGIACDIVERYWNGGPPNEWRTPGHQCRLTKDGLKPEEAQKVEKIESEFFGTESAA